MKNYILSTIIILSMSNCTKDRLNKFDIKAKNGAQDTRIGLQDFKVIKDDNGNGIVNVNETAYIQIFLKNDGPAYASEVMATCVPENTQATFTGVTNMIKVGGSYVISPSSKDILVQQFTTNLGVGYTFVIKTGSQQTNEKVKVKLSYNVRNVNGYNDWTVPSNLTCESTILIPVYQ